MALTRAQLLSGDSSQGIVLTNQVQGVKKGAGIAIATDGTITVDSQTIVGVMKLGQTAAAASAAYNGYNWPTATGTVDQQLTIDSVVGSVTTLAWKDPDMIPWTTKGQLVAATGANAQALLNVGTNGQILIADSSTTTGLNYTSNYVQTTGSTSSALIPPGTIAERPATPVKGAFRYNTATNKMEFWDGTQWSEIVSGTSPTPSPPGTVTSVGVSGGTTGFSFSSSPVTTTGTMTMSGTLGIANGGTGGTTQPTAINNLLPTQGANSGKYLTTDGTNVSWGASVSSFSAGSTGLTPVAATTGAVTLAGTLIIANGGTGGTTRQTAINNLLPSQATNSGKFLATDGTDAIWSSAVSSFSAGTTGLTPNVASTGAVTLAGTLAIANGGTSATTANAALNNLLPAQGGNASKVLATDGSNTSWASSVSGFSAGTTGLTPAANTTGLVTLAGTLNISNGGTGATTANAALNNLLPSQAGNAGRSLVTDGSNASWVASAAAVSSFSAGTTGFTPVAATTGAITLAGSLNVTNGGTGATTAAAALTNLLPSQAGNAGEFLTTDGAGTVSWAPVVTSFNAGTTGFTPNVASTGAVTLAGSLNVANGGTGATTAAAALTNLLPSQAGNAGKSLVTDGTSASWVASAAGVTSFSAGTTGFTPNVATTGAVTLSGSLAITNGGTGATTASAAIANLLPSQAGNAGKVLSTDGVSTLSWITPASGGLSAATLAEAAAGTINTKASTPETSVPKDAAGMTGAALIPTGTTAQQPGAPSNGWLRYNSTYSTNNLEVYTTSTTPASWRQLQYAEVNTYPDLVIPAATTQALVSGTYRNITIAGTGTISSTQKLAKLVATGTVTISGTISGNGAGPIGGSGGNGVGNSYKQGNIGYGLAGGAAVIVTSAAQLNSSYGYDASNLGSGGGGGAGVGSPGTTATGGNGGASGGSLIIEAQGSVVVSGTVNLAGANGSNGTVVGGGAAAATGGGGGSGGLLSVKSSTSIALGGTINVNGGNGGSPISQGGYTGANGGGGGGGWIVIQSPSNTVTAAINKAAGSQAAGSAGTLITDTSAGGAYAGNGGQVGYSGVSAVNSAPVAGYLSNNGTLS